MTEHKDKLELLSEGHDTIIHETINNLSSIELLSENSAVQELMSLHNKLRVKLFDDEQNIDAPDPEKDPEKDPARKAFLVERACAWVKKGINRAYVMLKQSCTAFAQSTCKITIKLNTICLKKRDCNQDAKNVIQ